MIPIHVVEQNTVTPETIANERINRTTESYDRNAIRMYPVLVGKINNLELQILGLKDQLQSQYETAKSALLKQESLHQKDIYDADEALAAVAANLSLAVRQCIRFIACGQYTFRQLNDLSAHLKKDVDIAHHAIPKSSRCGSYHFTEIIDLAESLIETIQSKKVAINPPWNDNSSYEIKKQNIRYYGKDGFW